MTHVRVHREEGILIDDLGLMCKICGCICVLQLPAVSMSSAHNKHELHAANLRKIHLSNRRVLGNSMRVVVMVTHIPVPFGHGLSHVEERDLWGSCCRFFHLHSTF